MVTTSSNQNGDSDGKTTETDTPTHKCNQWACPRSLIDGADHQKRVKLQIDPDTLPNDTTEKTERDINWAIEALNTVATCPNMVLSLRTRRHEVIFTYHYTHKNNHERSGYLRVAIFNSNRQHPYELTEEQEQDCGMLPFQEAVNLVYDVMAGYSSYSKLLIDLGSMNDDDRLTTTHPIFTLHDDYDQHGHLIAWGRDLSHIGLFPNGKTDRVNPVEWPQTDSSHHPTTTYQTRKQAGLAFAQHYANGNENKHFDPTIDVEE